MLAGTVVASSPWRRYGEDTEGRSMTTNQAGCSDLLQLRGTEKAPLKRTRSQFCHPRLGSHLRNHLGNWAYPGVLTSTRSDGHLHILSPQVPRLTFNCESCKYAPGMPLTFAFVCFRNSELSETMREALTGSRSANLAFRRRKNQQISGTFSGKKRRTVEVTVVIIAGGDQDSRWLHGTS